MGFLLQRIFPIQGSNLGLLHCRQILYCLRHQESPLPGDSGWLLMMDPSSPNPRHMNFMMCKDNNQNQGVTLSLQLLCAWTVWPSPPGNLCVSTVWLLACLTAHTTGRVQTQTQSSSSHSGPSNIAPRVPEKWGMLL